MKEEMYQWMRNLAFFYIFLTTVLQLVPEKKYEKYVRTFMGLLLIFMMCTPFFALVGRGQELTEQFAVCYDKIAGKQRQREFEDIQEKFLERGYEYEVRKKVEEVLAEKGIYTEKTVIKLNEEEARAILYMKRMPEMEERRKIRDGMQICGFTERTYEVRVSPNGEKSVGSTPAAGTAAGSIRPSCAP